MGIDPLEIRQALVKADLRAVLFLIGTDILGAVITGIDDRFRCRCDHTDMDVFTATASDLIAVERQKMLVRQLVMGDKHLMIGIRKHGIAVRGIELLELFRRLSAVRYRGMAMQIGTVMMHGIRYRCDQYFFHVGKPPLTINYRHIAGGHIRRMDTKRFLLT